MIFLNFLGTLGVCWCPELLSICAESIEYRAVDLGVGAWYANSLGPYKVVAIQDLSGNPVVCPLSIQGIDYWITVAFNHVSDLPTRRLQFHN